MTILSLTERERLDLDWALRALLADLQGSDNVVRIKALQTKVKES